MLRRSAGADAETTHAERFAPVARRIVRPRARRVTSRVHGRRASRATRRTGRRPPGDATHAPFCLFTSRPANVFREPFARVSAVIFSPGPDPKPRTSRFRAAAVGFFLRPFRLCFKRPLVRRETRTQPYYTPCRRQARIEII